MALQLPRRWRILLVLLALVGALGGCGAATPDVQPTPESDRAAPVRAVPAEAEAGEEISNEAGFQFVVPAGWSVTLAESTPEAGQVFLAPAGDSQPPNATQASLTVSLADTLPLQPAGLEFTPETTPADIFVALEAPESTANITLEAPESITVDGRAGLAASLTNTGFDGTVLQGRYALVRLDDGRFFALIGFAAPEAWDPAGFAAVLETTRFTAARE
jgi:hypothetical protein